MDVKLRGAWLGMSLLVVNLVGCGLALQEKGNGHLVQEERQTPDFVALEVEDGIAATVVVDATRPMSVRLVGDENLVTLIRTELEGSNTLHVHFRDEELLGWNSSNPLRVEVTVPKLEAFSRSGGGAVDLSGTLDSASFSLAASGGGTVKARGLATGSLSLDSSGGTRMTLEGRATKVTSLMSGGGTLAARELSASEATLSSSGGGSTELRVSDTLRVTASGGGEVRIVGRPSLLWEELSGGSTLSFE